MRESALHLAQERNVARLVVLLASVLHRLVLTLKVHKEVGEDVHRVGCAVTDEAAARLDLLEELLRQDFFRDLGLRDGARDGRHRRRWGHVDSVAEEEGSQSICDALAGYWGGEEEGE